MASPHESIPTARKSRSWWTWNLGRIAGIPIRVHLTLLILLAWIGVTYAIRGAGFGATAVGILLGMWGTPRGNSG